MNGIVIKSTGSWYLVWTDQGETLEVRLRGKFKLDDKKITNPVTVGDKVSVERINNDNLITEIFPRDNYVIRTSPRKKGHFHLLAANIDQALLVASLKHPKTSLGFIDRFLTTLETFRIPGIILFNKADLYDEEELNTLNEYKVLYHSIGYQMLITSLHDQGSSSLLPLLEEKTTLVAGHSGTGKSTLINSLFPDQEQAIGRISHFADKGVHTTTFGEMFLSKSYKVIDTPGIKELGLAEVTADELSHYFPEMRELLGDCRFHNCQHVNEPGCAVKEAVANGSIAESRFDSYLSMLFGEDNRR
jgi:ribosome biogenesis GTPase